MSSDFPDQPLDVYKSIFRDDILANKYAFVTGGGSGINFRITEGLMRHGCNVAIASRNVQRVETAAQRLNAKYPKVKCLHYGMDVTDEKQVEKTVSEILKSYPRIDILVNGAAGNFLCPAEKLSGNAFKRVLEIDTLGTFIASKQVFVQSMKKNGKTHGAFILNMSATLDYCGTILQSHSGSAKAAVDALTRHLAVEWGPFNVRVNGIAPGPIEGTTGFERLGGFLLGKEGEDRQRKLESFKTLLGPIARTGTSKEIADACVYLASDAATYISGVTLVMDGGFWMTSSNNFTQFLKTESKFVELANQKKEKKKNTDTQSKL